MTAERPDLYAVLGLPSQASQEQIRRAYRTIVRHNHPDTRVPSDGAGDARSNAVLAEVMSAYAVLGDPDRRARYDHHVAPPQRHDPRRAPTVSLFSAHLVPEPPIRVGPVYWRPSR